MSRNYQVIHEVFVVCTIKVKLKIPQKLSVQPDVFNYSVITYFKKFNSIAHTEGNAGSLVNRKALKTIL